MVGGKEQVKGENVFQIKTSMFVVCISRKENILNGIKFYFSLKYCYLRKGWRLCDS